MVEVMKKSVAIGIAGITAVVVAAWRQIQRDNTLATDTVPSGGEGPASPASPRPRQAPSDPGPASALFTPSVSEDSTKAELYEVATGMGIEGRSKMTKAELLSAIRAAS
jgi:hypothetical protein